MAETLTDRQLSETVEITCYNKTERRTRRDALRFYFEGMMACEGSERERYTNIYCQLRQGSMKCVDTEY